MGGMKRFWSKVNKDGPVPPHRPELGPCWVWTGATFDGGYGCLRVKNAGVGAHRLSWEMANGRAPTAWVLHHCDNPCCVRPEHLYEGTRADNTRDMIERGRVPRAPGERNGAHTRPDRVLRGDAHWARQKPWLCPRGDRNGARLHPEIRQGERNGRARLDEASVRVIRARYATGGETWQSLATAYGVSSSAMGSVLRRETWRDVV
jgi:hypothetical protein